MLKDKQEYSISIKKNTVNESAGQDRFQNAAIGSARSFRALRPPVS